MGIPEQLGDIAKKIGYEAYIFIVLSFVTLYFAKELGESAPVQARNVVYMTAGGLFSLGVLIALLRLFAVFFQHRPARGLFDGLAAGLLAGVVGGYFGYGFPDGVETYVASSFRRTLLCVLFATPIGGLLGLIFDLFHPDRPIPWKKYAGVFLLGLLGVFLIVGYGLSQYVPHIPSKGIRLGEIQLLFEVFLFVIAGLAAISFDWSARKVATRSIVLVVGILLARAVTLFAAPQAGGLWQREILLGEDIYLGAVVFAFMFWSMLTYAAFFTNHRVTRFLDALVAPGARPA